MWWKKVGDLLGLVSCWLPSWVGAMADIVATRRVWDGRSEVVWKCGVGVMELWDEPKMSWAAPSLSTERRVGFALGEGAMPWRNLDDLAISEHHDAMIVCAAVSIDVGHVRMSSM